jgi:hypothetical protein
MDKTILVVFLAVLAGLYLVNHKEYFTAAAIDNIGSLGDYNASSSSSGQKNYDKMYEYGSQYNPFYPVGQNVGAQPAGRKPVMVESFSADLPSDKTWQESKTVQRLDRMDSGLLPKVSSSVTPYNVDVADPVAYTFQVHAPRVIRKDYLAMQADPIRGDIPITYYPDIPIIQQSQYNRDSLRLDGAFSDAFKAQYDRLSGSNAYFNAPTYNSYGSSVTA